jgi:hypothetical protein
MVGIVIKLLDHLRYTLPRWPLVASITTTWMRREGRGEPCGSAAGVAGDGAP